MEKNKDNNSNKMAKQINYVNNNRARFNQQLTFRDNYGNYVENPYGDVDRPTVRNITVTDEKMQKEYEAKQKEYEKQRKSQSRLADVLLVADLAFTVVVVLYNINSWLWLLVNAFMLIMGVRLNNVKTVRFATISFVITLANIVKILYELGLFKLMDKILFS